MLLHSNPLICQGTGVHRPDNFIYWVVIFPINAIAQQIYYLGLELKNIYVIEE